MTDSTDVTRKDEILSKVDSQVFHCIARWNANTTYLNIEKAYLLSNVFSSRQYALTLVWILKKEVTLHPIVDIAQISTDFLTS